MMTCGDCDTVLDDVPTDQTCPSCGSTRQNAYVRGTTAVASGTAMSGGFRVDYNAVRPWFEQWHKVRAQLYSIEIDCGPDAYRGNDPIKRDFEIFFTQCFHLGDWLWGDTTTGLSDKQVRSFIDKDPALRICAGIANTSKHHTRSQANAMTARVTSVSTNASGTSVLIGWSEGPRSGTEDALDLARRCVAAWEVYLQANSLESPLA